MSENYRLVVDPYLLCFPQPCVSVDQIDEFVDRLLGWSSSLHRRDMQILVSDKARIALMDDGEYPEQHRLRKSIRDLNYDAADPETICRLVQTILDTTPSLEENLGIEDILIDESKTKINPSFLNERLNGRSKMAFMEILAMMSFVRVVIAPANNSAMFVSSAKGNDRFCGNIDVTVSTEIIECYLGNTNQCPPFPVSIQDQIPFAWSHNGLMQHVGVCAIWQSATCCEEAEEAIEQCVHALVQSGLDDSRRYAYRMGPRFLEAAKLWGFFSRTDYAMLLIESCARIVLGVPKNPINPFRVSSSASAAQRDRSDGALAFRTHLTKAGPGFRLMFWRLPNGTLEFANVGDKDELEIL